MEGFTPLLPALIISWPMIMRKIDIIVILLGVLYALRYPWPRDPLSILDLLALLVFAVAAALSALNLIQKRRRPHARKDQN